MPKIDVLGMLEANYKLLPESDYGDYKGNTVLEKQSYSTIGHLYFQNSKLCGVTKTWSEYNISNANNDTMKFGNELYDVFSKLSDEGKVSAKINLREYKEHGYNKVIEFEFEGKRVYVSVSDLKFEKIKSKTVSIEENIVDEELRKTVQTKKNANINK